MRCNAFRKWSSLTAVVLVIFALVLILIAPSVSCTTRDGVQRGGNKTVLADYKEVTIGDILADPENYAGQRVLVSGRFHALAHIALAVDWYWTNWGIGNGSDIMEVYLMSDECLIWSTLPDYEEDEEIRLPGVVSVELVGKGRFPSVCLLVKVDDVDIQTRPLITDTEPETLVGELTGGTGVVLSFDRGKGRCVIETKDGVKLDFRLIELPQEYQVVGLHIRFAGIGRIACDSPRDGIPIYLYYVENVDE